MLFCLFFCGFFSVFMGVSGCTLIDINPWCMIVYSVCARRIIKKSVCARRIIKKSL